jgi:hypothetical protein
VKKASAKKSARKVAAKRAPAKRKKAAPAPTSGSSDTSPAA